MPTEDRVTRQIVSSSTVSRRLSKEFGLKSHKTARNLYLTPVMKEKRLDFASVVAFLWVFYLFLFCLFVCLFVLF